MKNTQQQSQENCLHHLFERQVEQNSDAPAIAFKDRQISYGELNIRSNRIAHALVNHISLKINQPVAILLGNGPLQIEALLGILKAGCVFVCLDPAYPTNRLSTILEESTPPFLITESACLKRHPGLLRVLTDFRTAVLLLDDEVFDGAQDGFDIPFHGRTLIEACSDKNPKLDIRPTHPAYIVYTSGSTGKPKGIMQSHRSFSQFITWQSGQFGIVAPQRWAQWASIGYDASYCEIFGALCFGATLCMAKNPVRHDPAALVEWARKQRITILQFVPSFCRQVIEILKSEARNHERHPLPDLKVLLLAGEPLPVDLASTWLTEFPNPPKLFNLYGPSESVLATYYEVKEVKQGQISIPIGRAIDGREILILDDEKNRCEIGVRGDIYIRSQYLTMGYFQCPQETGKNFLQNPLHNDYPDPVYKTGDLGRFLPDGNIEFCGRADNLVKIRGFRVELGEIETVVCQHASVRESVVMAHEHTDGHKQLIAYLVSSQENPPDSSELRGFLREKLPEFMVPSVYMVLERFPVNANGKIDRGALPRPDGSRQESDRPFVAPRDPLEAKLVKIWQDVLDVRPVSVKDDFFDIGGNSLSAAQVFALVRKHFNKQIPLAIFFEASTVEQLAEVLRDRKVFARSLLVPMQPEGSRPPLFCVPGLGGDPIVFRELALHMDSDQPLYGLRSQGLDGLEAPLTTIVDIATRFVHEIQTLQPEGPYFLAGYSSGCEVIYEMARQFEEQDQKVELLAMLNYYLVKYELFPPTTLRQKLAWHASLFSGLTLLEKLIHLRNLICERIVRRRFFKELCKSRNENGQPLPRLLNCVGRVIVVNYVAEKEYQPQPYSGRITLFRAEGVEHDAELGLPGLAAQGVEIHNIKGDHVNMLREPYVQDLAAKLMTCLNKTEVTASEATTD